MEEVTLALSGLTRESGVQMSLLPLGRSDGKMTARHLEGIIR